MTQRPSTLKAPIVALVRSTLLHTTAANVSLTEYRSAVFFHTPEQETIARRVTQEVQEKHFTPKEQKITTTIEAAGPWYDAEDYHQEYLFKNPSGYQCPTHRLHW